MKIIKRIIRTVLTLAVGLCIGLAAVLMFQMYQPVLDAGKVIHEVDSYAMDVTDELFSHISFGIYHTEEMKELIE